MDLEWSTTPRETSSTRDISEMIDTMAGEGLHATLASSETVSTMAMGFTQWSTITFKDSSKRHNLVERA